LCSNEALLAMPRLSREDGDLSYFRICGTSLRNLIGGCGFVLAGIGAVAPTVLSSLMRKAMALLIAPCQIVSDSLLIGSRVDRGFSGQARAPGVHTESAGAASPRAGTIGLAAEKTCRHPWGSGVIQASKVLLSRRADIRSWDGSLGQRANFALVSWNIRGSFAFAASEAAPCSLRVRPPKGVI
jgi:hypothetical protein